MVAMMTFAFIAGLITALLGVGFSAYAVQGIRAGYDWFDEGLLFLGGLVIVVIGSCLMLPLVATTFDL